MDELLELELIEKQMNVEIAMNKIKNSTIEYKEWTLKHLKFLYTIIENAIEWDNWAIDYIKNIGNNPIDYPQKYTDDDWHIFEISWIGETALNQMWKIFDYKYKGSFKMWFYLNALTDYFRKVCWYRKFKIKLLSSKKK